MRFVPLLFLLLAGCDSSPSDPGDSAPVTGPAGSFRIEPVAFELHVVADENQGFYANYQGTIGGSLTLTVEDGEISGQGNCSWTTRIHRSWLGETNTASATQRFTAKGRLVDGRVTLDFQGCAWVMARHTGTFDGSAYRLRIPDPLSGPLYPPDIWDGAVRLSGDDPLALTLERS